VTLPPKKSDLSPPLGYPGGPCQVIQRIHSTVRNPKMRDELVDDVEGYKGLSNTDATKVYKLETEKGVKAKFLNRLRITPHAQYRMDQRGITVQDVRTGLMLFAREFYDSKSQQGHFYRSRSEELARGEKILWVAKKIGRLALVFVSAGQGAITLVTAYWDGLGDPKPVDESVCKVAERFALRQDPGPGIQTYVSPKSQLDLADNKDNSDKEPPSAAPLPGSAVPGGAGRDIGKFEYNTPGPGVTITPRTLGTPGEQRGHPTNFITPGTITRRTMTGEEAEGHIKRGYKRRWKPGVRQRKTKGVSKHKRKMYYRNNRHKIKARQKVWRQKNKNNPLHKYNRKHRRKNPNQHRRRHGSALVVAALYDVLAYSTGDRGGPAPTRQHRQKPAVARLEGRKYKRQKANRNRKALKRYHVFCKRNRQCLRQREMYRNSPQRYKRRPPGNKEAQLLVTPEIGFSIGKDMLLGYVHSISPMTGLVTFSVDSPDVNQLDSIPLDVFLRVVVFLEDADVEAFLELVDAEIGLEAYDDIDEDTVRYCARLYGEDPDSAEFKAKCMALSGQRELSALTVNELEQVNDRLVFGIMEGHQVRVEPEGEDPEDDLYDSELIYGDVPLGDREEYQRGKAAGALWYHGSPKRFEGMETSVRHTFGLTPSEVPLFFSPSKSFAKMYAQGPDGVLYTARLKWRKVFDGDDMYGNTRYWPPEYEVLTREGKKLHDDLGAGKIFPGVDEDDWSVFGDSQGLFANILKNDYDVVETTEFKKWLKKNGYDAAYVTGDGEKNVFVFSPKQVEIVNAAGAHGKQGATPASRVASLYREAGEIFLYDQHNPANNEIKQPGDDVDYRADSPSTYERSPDKRKGVPPGAHMPSNQTDNVPPASGRVIPDQMKNTLRDQVTYVKAGAARGPGVSRWTAAAKIYDRVQDIEYGSAKVIRRKGTEWLMTYRTSSGEERKVLVGGHESGAGQVSLSVRKYGSKTACVVAVTEVDGTVAMLKVRDRNYAPRIKVVREMIAGTEIAHLFDTWTGWSEGVNEYGIGVVSSALMVLQDEGEKKEPTGNSRNGKRIRQVLGASDMDEAIEIAMTALVSGCTFISNGDRTALIEYHPNLGEDPVLKVLKKGKDTVRTNHGIFLSGAGYTSGDDLKSSKKRKLTTEKILKDLTSIDDFAPAIARGRDLKDLSSPLNPVRATDNMSTSTQIVTVPAEKEIRIYLIPGEVDFVGIENKLPKGRTPRVNIELFEYEDWLTGTPKPVKLKGDPEVFRLFTYGSMMGRPAFPNDVIRSYPATIKGYHRAFNRKSQHRDGAPVLGTEPGGSLEGLIHEYPVEKGHRVLGSVDRRDGFRTERPEDKNSYIREALNVKTPDGLARATVYLSNPEGPNYHKPLTPVEAAKEIAGDSKAEKYLRAITKAMEAHGLKSSYVKKVKTQADKRKAVKTAMMPEALTDEKDHPDRRNDGIGLDTCSELPNGQEKTAAANLDEILSNCGPPLKGRAQDVTYKRTRRSPSGMSSWIANGSRGEKYTIKIKPIRKDKRIKAFAKVPIQVSCSCPYFRWQGPEHWAKKNGFLHGRQVGTASTPDIKDPKGKHWACKHVVAVLEIARKWRYASEDAWTYEGDIAPMADPHQVAGRYLRG
jgi:cation transport regulator ChaC